MFKMNDLPRSPSPLLKILTTVVHVSFGLLLAAWLFLIIAWGSLHLFIVPRIGEFRPQLEIRASQALGVPVRIGSVVARSEGLFPSFELSDVRLMDPQGREALHLPRVLASLSPRSLWHFGFEHLYIDRPQLDIRRAADGRIYVAGLDLSKNQDADGRAGDWFFSQTEFAIHEGSIQWTDELRGTPALALQQVDMVIRNTARKHALRLDATPPPEWGQRFTLMADFHQPLLSMRSGQWREWDGQFYAMFDRVDLSQLRRYASLGVNVAQGNGALRAWVDVAHGQIAAATADVVLSQVSLSLTQQHASLSLPSLAGRLKGRLLAGGFEFSTQDLQFETQEGLRWPGGNVRVTHIEGDKPSSARGELQADQLDLSALSQIVKHLPLDARFHAALTAYAPQGLVEQIQASWQGSLEAPNQFRAKGRVVRLAIAARAADEKDLKSGAVRVGSPGIHGANIDFDLTQSAGRVSVLVQDGGVALPGVFAEPALNFVQLSTDLLWQIDGERIAVQAPNIQFSNADAQGEAQLKWQTSDLDAGHPRSRFPGVLDLQGSMSRADATRVHRYLPLLIPAQVRDYLREAVPQGRSSGVRFRVKGDLHDFPFADPKQGDFRVLASLRDATFAYVPRSLQAADALPWPALTQFNGELLMERARLQLKDVNARLNNAPGVRISHADGLISDLFHAPVVTVNLDAMGPVGEVLGRVVSGSPVAAMTGHVLDQASASGNAEYQLRLKLPVLELHKSNVQGKVTLAGNELQISPGIPRLSRVRGVLHFSENGFAISAGQARLLGGDARAEGGTIQAPGMRVAGPPALRVQGTMTADGLRQASELGIIPRLAQQASGSAGYAFVLGVRRGVPELQFTSSLQGLALNLPAPLSKSAEAIWPLRLETALTRASLQPGAGTTAPLQDQLTLELGRLASAVYVRDVSGKEARVLRGTLGVGLEPAESVPMPNEGVVANINLDSVDLDAWGALLPASAATSASSAMGGYLPSSLAIRAKSLVAAGHKFSQVVAGGSREGQTWRANLDAHELSGYLEYRQPSVAGPGRLYARLARLSLAPTTAKDVENLLDEQPASIPALDIVVDDMELRGKKLGRVEIEAVNRGAGAVPRDGGVREWRLNRFNVIMPEAVFTATGNWALLNESASPANRAQATRPASERRRTVMNFKLDIADAGELLSRLGMKDVIRRGQGKMEGQVAWVGSPLALDYPTLGGAFNVNVETGQFLKADPGIAKLLGVLSLQSLPRRLTLDFRDVFSDGFAFDFVRGDVHIEQGMAATNNLQMKGVNAAVLMEGKADIAKETQDIKVVVVPEINAGTASLIATWINPAVGLGSFLAQLFLRRPLIESATQEFQISGSWADPKITRPDGGVKKEVKP